MSCMLLRILFDRDRDAGSELWTSLLSGMLGWVLDDKDQWRWGERKNSVHGQRVQADCPRRDYRRAHARANVEKVGSETPSFSVADDRYHTLLYQAYVEDSPILRWCPHPGCENVIECSQAPPRMLTQLVPTVTCNCGRELCFGSVPWPTCVTSSLRRCGHDADHRPVLCKLVRSWQKKCEDDSETANWLSANTKECSKCQATIEKNGGCK